MSISTITPLTLTGVSQFSTDFQNILNRAVQIAQIPDLQLQNQDSNILQQKSLLGSLNAAASSLLTSLQTLGTVATSQALSATSSDPTVLTPAVTGASTPGSYTINSVTSIASAASERSVQGYADSASTPASSTGILKLTAGSQDYALDVTGKNTLIGLRDAINASGAPVTASILTTGNGNYLSVSGNASGQTTLRLIDDPISISHPNGANTELLTQTNQGANAEFHLNGIDITQPGNTVNAVIPGVTFQLLKGSASAVTITLESNPSQLSSALQDFVTRYNALSGQLQAQVGPSAGLLSGDLVISQLQNTLWQLTTFTDTAAGSVNNIGQLGISFNDTTGQLSFDQNAFNALSSTQVSDGFKFLNSLAGGAGNFTAQLQSYTDPISGLIATEQQGFTTTDQHIQSQIAALTDRINVMQTNLQLQLAQADALEASLESQQKTITASLLGLNFVLYGTNTGSTTL
ncbi:MAG TPA: flagellar filament capping protein FliD [Bryobacteraceae bacterium]|nr:flagellar filament capping protein FliD [Bryobacteraceae bacterium]